MQFSSKKERNAILLGCAIVLSIVFYGIVSHYFSVRSNTAAVTTLAEKKKILLQMRFDLLKSVEMEKNAVMAITDEESKEYATLSRNASASVEKSFAEFNTLKTSLSNPGDEKTLLEFSSCWQELHAIDQIILESAIQNANIKATHLSNEKGSELIDLLEKQLEIIRQQNIDTPHQEEIGALLYHIMLSTTKIHSLHSPHISEAHTESMEKIELQIKTEESKVLQGFEQLMEITLPQTRQPVDTAKQQFLQFAELTAKVIELSRQNSNITSLTLSLGKKRILAAQCDEILVQLIDAIQTRSQKPRK